MTHAMMAAAMTPGSADKIHHLVDAPHAISILTRWFVEEWEPYYGVDGPGDAEADRQEQGRLARLLGCDR